MNVVDNLPDDAWIQSTLSELSEDPKARRGKSNIIPQPNQTSRHNPILQKKGRGHPYIGTQGEKKNFKSGPSPLFST